MFDVRGPPPGNIYEISFCYVVSYQEPFDMKSYHKISSHRIKGVASISLLKKLIKNELKLHVKELYYLERL